MLECFGIRGSVEQQQVKRPGRHDTEMHPNNHNRPACSIVILLSEKSEVTIN
jgi:hypothetical protein